ncbi:hypothetical protein [Aquimarina sp. 433]
MKTKDLRNELKLKKLSISNLSKIKGSGGNGDGEAKSGLPWCPPVDDPDN